MERLIQYGWNRYRESAGRFVDAKSHEQGGSHGTASTETNDVARVVSVQGNQYEVVTDTGNKRAELLGKLLFASEKQEQPKVGDWVRFMDYDDQVLISEVMPRVTELYRKSAGRTYEKQVMVANADQAVIIQGMDDEFNINRLERYIVQSVVCKVQPVVVLNKSDLAKDPGVYIQHTKKLQREVPVYACSVKTGEGLDAVMHDVFRPGITSVLIGSSGVGKSSLVNLLLGADRKTAGISGATGKGRHTTTTRDLFVTPAGAIVIDTPGMREFGIGTGEDVETGEQFPVIGRFAGECRFRDCSHVNEEGCNVIGAVERGELDAEVYENYLKLLKEQQRFQTSATEKKQQGKQFGKMVKEAKAYRKKYKY